MYWKLSMLITSMIGHTTRLLSSTTRASKGSSQSWVSCQLLLTKGKLITLLGSLCWISYQLLLTKAKFFTLLHSQCESRKVRMPEVAASAPLTLDLIRPSRLSFRRTRTFWIVESSSPSAAAIVRSKEVSHNGFNKHILPLWKILICRIFFFFTNSNSLEQSEVSARFWVGSRV